jgi:hypothetical protein
VVGFTTGKTPRLVHLTAAIARWEPEFSAWPARFAASCSKQPITGAPESRPTGGFSLQWLPISLMFCLKHQVEQWNHAKNHQTVIAIMWAVFFSSVGALFISYSLQRAYRALLYVIFGDVEHTA